jgi:AbrB family looped-hinge helix DNA binding protein
MRITSKGQVTIPMEIRDRLGLRPETEVEFDVVGNSVRLRKARRRDTAGRRLVERLKGRGTVRMTTDEILRLTRGPRST